VYNLGAAVGLDWAGGRAPMFEGCLLADYRRIAVFAKQVERI